MEARRSSGARVVVLTGDRPWHRHTVATLLASGANVVGVCVADDSVGRLPLPALVRSIRRRGVPAAADQVAGRILYRVLNAGTDRRHLRRIFDAERSHRIVRASGVPCRRTRAFGAAETLAWLTERRPDLFVVHSSHWVPRSVRRLAASGLVIGGHPGLTPAYRGAHSAFWAIYRGRPEDVGYSVFHLDGGVDTGDLICQGRIPVRPGDTYFSLGWRAMREIARVQAEVIRDVDEGRPVARQPHDAIPDGSEYPVPGLAHYLRFRSRQKRVR